MNRRDPPLSDEERAAFQLSIANVQRAAARQLDAHPDINAVIGFVAVMQRGVDKVIAGSADRAVRPDCKIGCNYCCSARVEAFAPEVFRIVRQLRQDAAERHAARITRLQAHVAQTASDLPWGQRLPCAFLDDGLCSIYAVRPSACRRAHSLDVAQCRAGAAEIPEDLELFLGAEALIVGTARAYQAHGLASDSHELSGAVLQVLADPTAEDRWHKGEQVFER